MPYSVWPFQTLDFKVTSRSWSHSNDSWAVRQFNVNFCQYLQLATTASTCVRMIHNAPNDTIAMMTVNSVLPSRYIKVGSQLWSLSNSSYRIWLAFGDSLLFTGFNRSNRLNENRTRRELFVNATLTHMTAYNAHRSTSRGMPPNFSIDCRIFLCILIVSTY